MMRTLNFIPVLALAAGALATTTHTRDLCTAPFNACLQAKSTRDPAASQFCSSYLSIGTVTSTTTLPPSVSVTTSTIYATTSTVIDRAFYFSCPPGGTNDKLKRAAATHNRPKCLRRFTASSAISHACSCLDIPSPTSTVTITPSPSMSTTTTSVDSATTSTQEYFYMSATGPQIPAYVYLGRSQPIALYGSIYSSRFQLADAGSTPCALYTELGELLFATPGGGDYQYVFFNQSSYGSTSEPVTCTLDATSSMLSCSVEGAYDNNIGDNYGSASIVNWALADAADAQLSYPFNITAVVDNTSS